MTRMKRVSGTHPALTGTPLERGVKAGVVRSPLERGGASRRGVVGRALGMLVFIPLFAVASQLPPPVKPAGDNGPLEYLADEAGNRVPDFSHAGYGGGGVPLPVVPARVLVPPVEGDDGPRIQAAIDFVAGLAPDAAGLRGAVQLAAGRYEIAGQLKITASGIVLRGSGAGEDGTVLVATGTDRRALIEIAGNDRRRNLGEPLTVADEYVSVGAMKLRLAGAAMPAVGASIKIERPSPAEWIKAMGMDDSPGRQGYQWRPNTLNVSWDRVVTAVDGDTITLDAPLTVALERGFGGATARVYAQEGYLTQSGIEHLRCESAFDAANPLDEQHAWNAIDLHALRDGWVADVTAVHFAGSAVQAGAKVARVTVQDCRSLAPVSEVGGYRRMAFHSRGQQVLFLRCFSEEGRNDFTAGYLAAGPNVFLECEARASTSFSGSLGSLASGLLFDGVKLDGGSLRLDNLETFNQGVGWAAVNSMLWQCSAATIVCRSPPGAHNWAVAVWGQFVGAGRWSMVNEFARPDSLYRAQLADRLGVPALAALAPRSYPAPPADLPGWNPASGRVDPEVGSQATVSGGRVPSKALALENGLLLVGGQPLSGKEIGLTWWRGRLEPARAKELGPALTRFVPGRMGTGLTDEPPAVAAAMVRNGQVVLRHHYGLWYERRRDDHQMIRRPDADVWPPFFEQPFARSGQGKAWDGLSRYDLTKYNPWYFSRLRAFAAEARQHGLVLVNEMYFQHNIIESGAHWVDSPWRPVNNVNGTPFPEPPPFIGDRIRMADTFYKVSDPAYRALHRAYIRQCLTNLADEPNVIHTLTAENSGPLHFMQFWLDVVAEWERDTGKHPLIALSAPKDVQDAVLADPARAAIVDVIDLTYWFRTDDGKEFAPAGGQSLAPREHLRKWKDGRPSAASVAAMVREYRGKFPGKAVITGLPEAGDVQPR
jgi:hypothetical protein